MNILYKITIVWEEDYKNAYNMFEKGQHLEALKLLDSILLENTIVEGIWQLKGDIYFDLEQYGISLRCYLNETKTDNSKSYVISNKGRQILFKDPEESIRWFDEYIALDTTSAMTWYHKAYALFLLKQYDKALSIIENGLKLNPGRNAIHMFIVLKGFIFNTQRRYNEAMDCFNEVIDSLKEGEAGDIVNVVYDACKGLIISYMKLIDFTAALEYCQKLPNLDKASSNYESINILQGYCNLESNNISDAVQYFNNVINKNALNLEALYGRGLANIILGEREEYKMAFDTIVNSNLQDDIDDLFYLASSYSNLDKDSLAIHYFQKMLMIDHDDPRALSGMATSLLKLGRITESQEYIKKARSIDGEDLYALTIEGSILIEIEDFENAEKLFDYVLSKDKNHINAILQRSMLFNRIHNYEEATLMINKILEKYPNYILARIIFSMISYSSDKVNESIDYLKKNHRTRSILC